MKWNIWQFRNRKYSICECKSHQCRQSLKCKQQVESIFSNTCAWQIVSRMQEHADCTHIHLEWLQLYGDSSVICWYLDTRCRYFFFVSSVYPSLCYVLWLLQINKMNIILTHNRHLAIRQLWHWAANRYLQRGDIECSHIVFTATFIIIVDNILSYIIIRTRIFDMRLTSPIVYNKHKYQNCLCVVLIYTSFIWIYERQKFTDCVERADVHTELHCTSGWIWAGAGNKSTREK